MVKGEAEALVLQLLKRIGQPRNHFIDFLERDFPGAKKSSVLITVLDYKKGIVSVIPYSFKPPAQ